MQALKSRSWAPVQSHKSLLRGLLSISFFAALEHPSEGRTPSYESQPIHPWCPQQPFLYAPAPLGAIPDPGPAASPLRALPSAYKQAQLTRDCRANKGTKPRTCPSQVLSVLSVASSTLPSTQRTWPWLSPLQKLLLQARGIRSYRM